MLSSVIENIDTQISALINKTIGLTRFEHKGESVYPAVYSGGGESEHINFDFYLSQSYHRINGAIDTTDVDSETSGCGIDRTEGYSMKLVLYFPNNILGGDDAYSAYRMSNNIKKLIPDSFSTIANEFNLYDINLTINSVNLDSFDVWSQEFQNVEFAIPSNYNLISIDYQIIVNGEKDCFFSFTC